MTDDLGNLFDLLDDMMGSLPPEAMLGFLHACIDDLEAGADRIGGIPGSAAVGMTSLH